jgi:hypothetical protein
MPPFDVLEKGKVFVEDNMEKWIKNTLKEVQDNLKGATL